MTDPSSKKQRKSAVTTTQPPPEDISESTEDLTKIGNGDNKLKKSSEWGTLQDAIWPGDEKTRKKSLEKSESLEVETSRELYDLPLSKRLTQEFIESERLFDIGEDNALARIVNDGRVVKSPTPEELEQKLIEEHPLTSLEDEEIEEKIEKKHTSNNDEEASFEKAVRYFVEHSENGDFVPGAETIVSIPDPPEELYAGKKEIVEEPMSKVTLRFGCPGCDDAHDKHHTCSKKKREDEFETHYAKPISLDDEITVTVNSAKPSYVTEIKVSSTSEQQDDDNHSDEEIVAILEPKVKQQPNGKLPKKPPVPPRRSDAPRFVKTEDDDRQVVYVSEYRMREPEKRYESSWAHLQDEQEINPWGNGSSPSQPVTSIVLGDDQSVTK